MGHGRVFDYEGGGHDRGGEFAAVLAVADEDLGQVVAFDWLLGGLLVWKLQKERVGGGDELARVGRRRRSRLRLLFGP